MRSYTLTAMTPLHCHSTTTRRTHNVMQGPATTTATPRAGTNDASQRTTWACGLRGLTGRAGGLVHAARHAPSLHSRAPPARAQPERAVRGRGWASVRAQSSEQRGHHGYWPRRRTCAHDGEQSRAYTASHAIVGGPDPETGVVRKLARTPLRQPQVARAHPGALCSGTPRRFTRHRRVGCHGRPRGSVQRGHGQARQRQRSSSAPPVDGTCYVTHTR